MIRGEGLYDLKVRAKEDGEWKFFSMVSDFDKQNGEMDVAVLFNSLDRMEQRYEARTATRWTGVKDLAGEEIYFMDLVQEQSPGGNGRVFLVAGTDEKRGQVIITAVSGSVLIANPPLCEMKKIGDYYDEKFAGLFSKRGELDV